MKKIIMLLCFVLSITIMSNDEIYYYGEKKSIISGEINRETIRNPEGYGKNTKIFPYFLTLDVPISVLKGDNTDSGSRYDIFTPEENVNKIHLIFDSTKFSLKELRGKKVRITGIILHANSRYHYTKVVLEVENIEVID